jgi:hypothetical protein
MMGSSGWYVKENHFLFTSSDLRHKANCTEHKKILLLFTIATTLKIFIVLPYSFASSHNSVNLWFEQTILFSARVS